MCETREIENMTARAIELREAIGRIPSAAGRTRIQALDLADELVGALRDLAIESRPVPRPTITIYGKL